MDEERIRKLEQRVQLLESQLSTALRLAGQAIARTFPEDRWFEAWAEDEQRLVDAAIARGEETEITAAYRLRWDGLLSSMRVCRQLTDPRTLPAARESDDADDRDQP